jgi:hypothetical protein
MSISKTDANSQSAITSVAVQSAVDSEFIAQSDLLITSQISIGSFKATLSLTKGVSAANVMKHYQTLGYTVLLQPSYGYGYDSNAYNGLGEGYGSNDYNLDQPVELFGSFWEQYWANTPVNLLICDGKSPIQIYLSWA